MTMQQEDAIQDFMRLVLKHLHPNIDEYPIEEMEKAEYSGGYVEKERGFEGTAFENSEYLIEAYYMLRCIREFDGR